jgi:hypothetical protein
MTAADAFHVLRRRLRATPRAAWHGPMPLCTQHCPPCASTPRTHSMAVRAPTFRSCTPPLGARARQSQAGGRDGGRGRPGAPGLSPRMCSSVAASALSYGSSGVLYFPQRGRSLGLGRHMPLDCSAPSRGWEGAVYRPPLHATSRVGRFAVRLPARPPAPGPKAARGSRENGSPPGQASHEPPRRVGRFLGRGAL